MGLRGPAPKPTALHILQGTTRADRQRSPVGKGGGQRPTMPRDLPPAARLEWRRVVPILTTFKILSPVDRRALADYCLCAARLDECEADISARGLLIDGERGKVKNPAAQLARQYRTELRQWCKSFGLTPDSRGRMNLPTEPDDSDDDFARLLD